MLKSIFSSRRYSLRRNLMSLVIVCVLPVALVSATLAYSTYVLQREHVEQQTELMGRAVLADLDRDFASIESGLKVLATAQELTSGDLRRFHQRARDALAPGIGYNYVVTDRQGRQLVNTLPSYGTPLPPTGTPPQLARVFTHRATVLTDMFIGPVTHKPAIAMGVPVGTGDQVTYSLNIGLDLKRIAGIVSRAELPTGWLLIVLDSSGTIVGRSRDIERYIGQKAVPEMQGALALHRDGNLETLTKEGVPVFTAYVTSKPWQWSVVVAAPKAALQQGVVWQLLRVLGGILAALGLGLWLARTISLRVLSSVRQLNEAALSLSRGEEVQLPTMQFIEAEAVGDALLQASHAMKTVKFLAQHDPLTELPNRLLFDEVARHNLSLAHRKGQTLALLAVDLDGFKAVNDTYGHAAGDTVLETVALRIQETIRGSDIAARMGGDEFIIMLSDVREERAVETAQRIIALLSQPYTNIDLPVSASVGVALYPWCGDSLETLTVAADQALYRAKQEGKKRVVVAGIFE